MGPDPTRAEAKIEKFDVFRGNFPNSNPNHKWLTRPDPTRPMMLFTSNMAQNTITFLLGLYSLQFRSYGLNCQWFWFNPAAQKGGLDLEIF